MCLEIAFSCLILPNIIIPKTLFQLNEKSILCELKFADPHFNKSDRISKHSFDRNNPILQKTQLEWIVTGRLSVPPYKIHNHFATHYW